MWPRILSDRNFLVITSVTSVQGFLFGWFFGDNNVFILIYVLVFYIKNVFISRVSLHFSRKNLDVELNAFCRQESTVKFVVCML